MSLTELSRRTGLDKAYLHRLETGERENPSWRTVMLVARALELSGRLTDELLERAYFAPLPPLEEYDGRYRRRGWGSAGAAGGG
jgi:transcriptional regulator with XRE-family HTH domain